MRDVLLRRGRRLLRIGLPLVLVAPAVVVTAAPAVAAPAAPGVVADASALPSGTGATPLDLTAAGGVDWLHLDGTTAVRKAGVTPTLGYANLAAAQAVTAFGDSPVAFTWSDGTPTASSTGVTTGAVFNSATEYGPTADGGGYRLTVPAADTLRKLVFVGGIWNSRAHLTVQDSVGGVQAWSTDLYAEGTATSRLYSITIAPGHGAVVTTTMNYKFQPAGNVSLAGAALSVVGAAAASFTAGPAPSSVDLTAEGSQDWLYSDGPTQVRKAPGTASALTLANRGTADVATQGDNPVAWSWTDGTPTASGTNVHHGGVFLARGAAQDTPLTAPYGYDLTVAAAPSARTLLFVSGIWNATVVYSVHLNGAADPAYEVTRTIGGNATTEQFTLSLAAGDAATVTAQITRITNGDGNVALGGVTMAAAQDTRSALQDLVADAPTIDPYTVDAPTLQQATAVQAYAADVASDSGSTDAEVLQAFTALTAARHLAAAGLATYTYQSWPGLVTSFGWEGDINAPIAYVDGSYLLRSRDNARVTFGIKSVPGKIDWTQADGYLPAFTSTFTKNGLTFAITNFADDVTIGGNRFEVAYSRMTVTNPGPSSAPLPVVSDALTPLNDLATATSIPAGATYRRDYAVAADRFGGTYDWPATDSLKAAGGYDDHFTHMADYWNDRLAAVAQITALPDPELIDSYKAGYIYTLIVRDDVNGQKALRVGENGYDELFDHDTIGIVANLLTMGDFTYAKDYLATLPAQLQYDDGKYKYSWPYALYLQRTDDVDFVRDHFATIQQHAHEIHSDRIATAAGPNTGYIKTTNAIDSNGYWTVDDWSALEGLMAYRYLAQQTGNTAEAAWALAEYQSLYTAVNTAIVAVQQANDIGYIPISLVQANEDGARADPRDANWASMFLFGRWAWDGYLFGAPQSGAMLDDIDATYQYGFDRRVGLPGASTYAFGGYAPDFYSSAYNAGYGSAALRGDKFRDEGIQAYQWMIDHAQSGPNAWWESAQYPDPNSPWGAGTAPGGQGSSPHMWGQANATKVLFDSLLSLKSDGTVIVGRGIPTDWLASGKNVALNNFPVAGNKRVGFSMTTTGRTVQLDFNGDTAGTAFTLDMMGLQNNIKAISVTGAKVDKVHGTATLPAGTTSVTITLQHAVDLGGVIAEAAALDQSAYTAATWATFAAALTSAQAVAADAASDTPDRNESANALRAAINQLARKAATVLTATPDTVTASAGSKVKVTATVTGSSAKPTGTVTATSGSLTLATGTLNAAGKATLSVPTASLATGTRVVRLTYSGDATYARSVDTVTVNVTAASSTTALALTRTTAPYGTAVTATATVKTPNGVKPTGPVTFSVDGKRVGSAALDATGHAKLALPSTLAVGNHAVLAAYGGHNPVAGSSSPATTLTVVKAAAKVAITAPAGVRTTAQTPVAVAVTSAVTPVTGRADLAVTASDGRAVFTTPVTVTHGQGSAVIPKLSVGSYTITVSWPGTARVAAASATKLLTVRS